MRRRLLGGFVVAVGLALLPMILIDCTFFYWCWPWAY